MAEFIKKIRTADGDKQIDYSGLANKPAKRLENNAVIFNEAHNPEVSQESDYAAASLSEGRNTVVYGASGHAEGVGTRAGAKGYYIQALATMYEKYTYKDYTDNGKEKEGIRTAEGVIVLTDEPVSGKQVQRLSVARNFDYESLAEKLRKDVPADILAEEAFKAEYKNKIINPYSENDWITVSAGHRYDECRKILRVENNFVYVSGVSSLEIAEDADNVTMCVPAKPQLGIDIWKAGAHAEGIQTKALGMGAHAEGSGSIALGDIAHAEGSQTKAYFGAHAEGKTTVAKGQGSHAEGIGTYAKGTGAHAEGIGDGTLDTVATVGLASGDYSHSEGIRTKATAPAAHSEGRETVASSDSAHAEGQQTKATGEAAHAEGKATLAYGKAHAEGEHTRALGTGAHAEGRGTLAKGSGAHAEGYGNGTADAEATTGVASGSNSHSEGAHTIASGAAAHAEGNLTIAEGQSSHAEGANTYASGLCAHAEGENTSATNKAAHAEGVATEASGVCAHAEGHGTVAAGNFQHVQGKWNKGHRDRAFIIGNGTDANNRSNALALTWDGKFIMKDVSTQQEYYVYVMDGMLQVEPLA